MKINLFYSVVCLAVGIVFYACKGPQGDIGPAGSAGAKGDVGAVGIKGDGGVAGAKGDPGAAKVVYTAWKSMVLDGRVIPFEGDYLFFSNANKTEPAFTKEAIDQGVLLTYLKVNSRVLAQNSTTDYVLQEAITTNANVLSYYKIPGRTQNRLEDYQATQVFYDNTARRENFFDPGLYFFRRVNFSTGAFVPELQNLTNDQCKALVKDMPQYRHVVIYGSTKGRLAAIDLNNYAAVKAAFNIAD